MLDGHFRTISGFCTLVDKEWIHFGHKFADRIGVAAKNSKDEERSPVFIQFLDCVHQLTTQFPAAFEFDDALLQCLAHHLFSGRFGNFISNSYKVSTSFRQSNTTWFRLEKTKSCLKRRNQYGLTFWTIRSTSLMAFTTNQPFTMYSFRRRQSQKSPSGRDSTQSGTRELRKISAQCTLVSYKLHSNFFLHSMSNSSLVLLLVAISSINLF